MPASRTCIDRMVTERSSESQLIRPKRGRDVVGYTQIESDGEKMLFLDDVDDDWSLSVSRMKNRVRSLKRRDERGD